MDINGLILRDETWLAICRHAMATSPQEACGLVVGGGYQPVTNASSNQAEGFSIPPEVWLQAELSGGVEVVVHSHPDGPATPSAADMTSQMASGVPWLVVVTAQHGVVDQFAWGDALPIPPLVGRRFRHGVLDCYSLVRHWYRQERGIQLPDFPREDNWWQGEGDLYQQGYASAGFQEVDPGKPTAGDVVLFAIPGMGSRRGTPANHAGIYLGDDTLLHHLYGRLSKREPLTRWQQYTIRTLRHTSCG